MTVARGTIGPVDDSPPEEAYGRVTNPERYRVLHTQGWDLVGRLAQDYRVVVEHSDGLDIDEELTRRTPVETIVRLAPLSADAARLTLAFTRFPGLMVRFGRWHIEAYPACGCDACDEPPGDLVEQLRVRVDALVAGRFAEGITANRPPWLVHEFAGIAEGSSALDRTDSRRAAGPIRLAWSPWQARP